MQFAFEFAMNLFHIQWDNCSEEEKSHGKEKNRIGPDFAHPDLCPQRQRLRSIRWWTGVFQGIRIGQGYGRLCFAIWNSFFIFVYCCSALKLLQNTGQFADASWLFCISRRRPDGMRCLAGECLLRGCQASSSARYPTLIWSRQLLILAPHRPWNT